MTDYQIIKYQDELDRILFKATYKPGESQRLNCARCTWRGAADVCRSCKGKGG